MTTKYFFILPGFITNTRLTDATPAALYAHTAARQWECESEMPSDRPESVKDITWQLVNNDPGETTKLYEPVISLHFLLK